MFDHDFCVVMATVSMAANKSCSDYFEFGGGRENLPSGSLLLIRRKGSCGLFPQLLESCNAN